MAREDGKPGDILGIGEVQGTTSSTEQGAAVGTEHVSHSGSRDVTEATTGGTGPDTGGGTAKTGTGELRRGSGATGVDLTGVDEH
jgi:hypothetical protein